MPKMFRLKNSTMKQISDDKVNEAIEKLALYCLKNNENIIKTRDSLDEVENWKTVTDNNGKKYQVSLEFKIRDNVDGKPIEEIIEEGET